MRKKILFCFFVFFLGIISTNAETYDYTWSVPEGLSYNNGYYYITQNISQIKKNYIYNFNYNISKPKNANLLIFRGEITGFFSNYTSIECLNEVDEGGVSQKVCKYYNGLNSYKLSINAFLRLESYNSTCKLDFSDTKFVATCPVFGTVSKLSYIGFMINANAFPNGFSSKDVKVGMAGDFTWAIDSTNALITEQEKTNEKLNDLNKTQQETNKQLEETKDFITSNDAPNADVSGLGNVQGLLPPGPVDSLLNIPFQFLSILTSSFSGTCVPMKGKFVFDMDFTIPCFSDIFYDKIPPFLMSFIDLVPSAFILILYFKHLYKKVDRAVSMDTNSDDEWGVI